MQIKADVERDYHLFFVPRKTILCERALEHEGVLANFHTIGAALPATAAAMTAVTALIALMAMTTLLTMRAMRAMRAMGVLTTLMTTLSAHVDDPLHPDCLVFTRKPPYRLPRHWGSQDTLHTSAES